MPDQPDYPVTREQALALFESMEWEGWSHAKRALTQVRSDILFMPFGDFHESLEKALDRPVLTTEIGLNREGLLKELESLNPDL